ncbi:MAG: AHH domain-containing protein, partial [Alphaproteobacteria bacterium]
AIEALEIAGLSLMAVGVVEGIIEVKEGYDKNGVKGALHVLREYLGAEISTCGMAGATRAAARLCGSVQKGLAALNHIPLAQREKVLQSFSNLFKVEGVPVPALSVASHVPQFPQGVKGGGSGGGHGHVPKEAPPQGPQKEYNLQDRRDRVRGKFGKDMAQVHHIISPTNPITSGHPLWALSGIGKNARQNLVILPTPQGADLGGKRAIHNGRHNQDVHRILKEQMDRAVNIGRENKWNEKQYLDAMKRIMQAERKALVQGQRALGQKDARPGAEIQFKLEVNFEGI